MMGTLVVKRITMSFSIKRCKPLILADLIFSKLFYHPYHCMPTHPDHSSWTVLILIIVCQHIMIIPYGVFTNNILTTSDHFLQP